MCNEMLRVLKPGGQFVLIDLRRNRLLSLLEKEMRAAYTLREVLEIVKRTRLQPRNIKQTMILLGVMGLEIPR